MRLGEMNGRWKARRDRAGTHCQQVHHAVVEQGQLDLMHVQADEIRIKGRGMIVWMGLALMVSTRLWLAGVVSPTRDMALADRLMRQVRVCAQSVRAWLVCTDGRGASPNSIRRAFRKTRQRDGGTRTSLLACLAAVAHWHSDQAQRQETRDLHHASDGSWDARASHHLARALTGRNDAPYGHN